MTSENFDNVNHLVLNFYPDGYSIAVKLNEFPVFTSETILETAKISYEETSLLDYIENEELPPLLVEMIDGSPKLSQYKIWHNGCLILEVRDKINLPTEAKLIHTTTDIGCNTAQSSRQDIGDIKSNLANQNMARIMASQGLGGYDDSALDDSSSCKKKSSTNSNYFILLKPTNLSMLNDVLNLTESTSWSYQDRLQLESQIVLHNSPALFLEPDASIQPPPEQSSHWTCIKTGNSVAKTKKRLPHAKLKNMCWSSSSNGVNYYKDKYSSSNNMNPRNRNNNQRSSSNNNDNIINSICNDEPSLESLPPELTLQQFLATNKARKKSFPAGHLARFHRFKKNLTSNTK